jgi:hypothetical protein
MNTEFALNAAESILKSHLENEIRQIEAESNALVPAPAPQEFFVGERDQQQLTLFPNVAVAAGNSNNKDDEEGFSERSVNLSAVIWIVEVDPESLQRFLIRYADAVSRSLMRTGNWANNLHSPVINMVTYSDIYQTIHGLAQGCKVDFEIKYIVT